VNNADTTTGSLVSNLPVTLGAYADGSQQLAFDIDVLRVTRSALDASQLMPANFAEPPRYPPPARDAGAPDTIANLKFWLPAYDYTRFFGDATFADPLPITPALGSAVHSAIDASSNQFRVTTEFESREILYADDPSVGPNWLHASPSPLAGHPWVVQDSNGTSAHNFDFVQNTGVFTLSAFIKPGAIAGA